MSTHPDHTPVALTIAGSDSSGGAGVQADLKTFSALGVYGASVITAITAQNTQGVQAVAPVEEAVIAAQIQSVLADLAVGAIKTGMLHNEKVVALVCSALEKQQIPLVVDPVMVSTSGDHLLAPAAVKTLRERLLPVAMLVTPNLEEAAVLLGTPVATTIDEMKQQALQLLASGCQAVLLKGGHLPGKHTADVFVSKQGMRCFEYEKIATPHTHGTGCTLSAAITAQLANGADLALAIMTAREYLYEAIMLGDTLKIIKKPSLKNHGPVHHFYRQW